MKKNNTTNMNQNTTPPTHPVFQDMPEVAQMKTMFPFCKSAKIGNLYYPMIANDNLMDFIVFDDNFVAAARKVKLNASNPSGSEHRIVKKVCDMFIDNPRFREIIRQDLLQGIYCPERIASDSVFKAKYRTFPRGFKNTVSMLVQTAILQVFELSLAGGFSIPHAWSNAHNPGLSVMFDNIDHIREQEFKSWISLNLKSFRENIPHDRLMEKIRIMIQDRRVVKVICDLLGLNTTSAGDFQTKHVGIPKDSPLSALFAYELYLSEFDQEMKRLGITYARYNDEIIVFGKTYEDAEQIKDMLVDFTKNVMKCPIDYNRTKIKDISRLAFLGLLTKSPKIPQKTV